MKDLETIILPVLEMSCAVCANNVENTMKGLPGVEEASVNFAANTLSVKYHPSLITPQKMREAVQEAGYDLVVEVEDPTAVQEEMAATPEYDRGVGTFHSAGPAGNGVYAYARR